VRLRLHIVITFLLFLDYAYAQKSGRDMKKEAVIWTQLQESAPGLIDTFKEATIKMDAGDYMGAAVLYQKIVDAAPQFDGGLRRLGMCLVSAGQTEKGFNFLEKAVELNRSSDNLSGLARSLAFPAKGAQPPRATLDRAMQLILEASHKDIEPDLGNTVLVAQLALSTSNEKEFRLASSQLIDKFPSEAASHYFNAVRLAMDEHWTESEDEIERAQQLGLSPNLAKEFLDSGVHTRASAWRYAGYSLRLVVAWIAGLILLFIAGRTLSALTLSSIEHESGWNAEIGSNERKLRQLYRGLINIAAFYYYFSLPIVVFLLIAVAGSIFYAFIQVGQIPIRLMLVLGVGTLVTIVKMVHSFFIKSNEQEPGRSLKPSEAPGLWKVAQDVARDVGTRPIEEIRITPGTELAVYESGTRKEKAQDKSRRVLILGIGVLKGFRTTAFKAVLAHEYGHFSHRDTAGGDAALRVGNDMMKFAFAMATAGQAVWWNLGFQFVRVYHFLFRRISLGASRLQEVLADRTAALRYGSASFEEGLTHVIRRSVELNRVAHRKLGLVRTTEGHLDNIYDAPVEDNSTLDEEVKKSLNYRSSEDDTHPSPVDRFRYVRKIVRPLNVPEDQSMVWDLFANRARITEEMTALVNRTNL
jgi:Zn-dependent protease with chaperone function